MTVLLPFILLSVFAEDVLPTPLLTPPFERTHNGSSEIEMPELELLESTDNGVVDYELWFENLPGQWSSATFHNGGVNDAIRGEMPPAGIASVIRTPDESFFHLSHIVNSGDFILAFYGSPPNRFDVILYPRILVIKMKETFKTVAVLDFLSYSHHPEETSEEEMEFTFQALRWAEVVDGVLYISNAHRTYASTSNGSNAYITAIDIATLQILWRSRPLISNSQNFLIDGDVIITGYGFTDEDDYLYAINRHTGEVLTSISVPSKPDYFFQNNQTLYVRCYDSDCLFSIN